jgi:hypothetical protein
MRSPFPGMDPYLERYWRDVHHALCTYGRDALQPQVRPKLVARLDEQLLVEDDEQDEAPYIVPDVRIEQSRGGPVLAAGAVVAEAEPLVIRYTKSEPQNQGFVTITDPTDGNRMVTVIEFLSPTNKRPGASLKQYRKKQAELCDAKVSLVEIDLVRAGAWALRVPRGSVPRKHREPYNVCVTRGWQEDVCEVYAIAINRALPKVRIPLRRKDADAVLDLQELLDRAYENGAYDDRLDYAADADPPLTGNAAVWADELLRQAGKRPAAI